VHIVPITGTVFLVLVRLRACQDFHLTPGLLPEHRVRNVRLRVQPHLRSLLGRAPAADLEGAIRMAQAVDLAEAEPVAQAADSAAAAMAGDAWEDPGAAADTAAATDNSHVWRRFLV